VRLHDWIFVILIILIGVFGSIGNGTLLILALIDGPAIAQWIFGIGAAGSAGLIWSGLGICLERRQVRHAYR
jgi:hypothetical protein